MIPNPAEDLNESRNFWKERSRNAFSVNLLLLPVQINAWPWIPASLNIFNGRSKERSAKAVMARSPPIKSSPEALSELSPSALSPTCLLGSAGPSPLDLKPKIDVGPPKKQTGEELPPMKNLWGRYEGVFRDPFPHGRTAPAEIPKFNAAL